jgi:hypothetical protein
LQGAINANSVSKIGQSNHPDVSLTDCLFRKVPKPGLDNSNGESLLLKEIVAGKESQTRVFVRVPRGQPQMLAQPPALIYHDGHFRRRVGMCIDPTPKDV